MARRFTRLPFLLGIVLLSIGVASFFAIRVAPLLESLAQAFPGIAPSLQYERCQNEKSSLISADRRISDCTELIRSAWWRGKNLAQLYHSRGNAHRTRGDIDAAIADYSSAIQVDPTFALAFYNRGTAYHQKGYTDSAIADYTNAIEINPSDELALQSRALAYNAKGDNKLAISDYTRQIGIH